MSASRFVLEHAISFTSNNAEESQAESDDVCGTERQLARASNQDKNLLCGLTKSSGDNESSGSLLYPESWVLDELKESRRGHSCAVLSFGRGAGPYETWLKNTGSIAQSPNCMNRPNDAYKTEGAW